MKCVRIIDRIEKYLSAPEKQQQKFQMRGTVKEMK